MDFILNAFRMGGPFMGLLVLAGLLHFVLCVIQALIGKRKSFIPLLFASLAGILLLGAIGTAQGLVLTLKALGAAAPEMVETMLHNGIAISLYTFVFALIFCFLGGWAMGFACWISGKEAVDAQ